MNILIDYSSFKFGAGTTIREYQLKNIVVQAPENNYFVIVPFNYSIEVFSEYNNIVFIYQKKRKIFKEIIVKFIRFPIYLKKHNIDIVFNPGNYIWYFGKSVISILMVRDTKNVSFEFIENSIINIIKMFSLYILTRTSIKKADKVLFVSRSIKKSFKGEVVYNGLNCTNSIKKPIDRDYDLSVITSGFLAHKNIELILSAMKILRNNYNISLNLLIIGYDSNENRFKKFKRKIEKMNLENDIDITGFVEHSEIYNYLPKSRMYISPSLTESFSNTVFEALASNVPVLLSDIAIYREHFSSKYLSEIIFNPYKANELAMKIKYFIENYNELDRIKVVMKSILKKYTWENHAKKLIEIFDELYDSKN